jgi:hypothetical protein
MRNTPGHLAAGRITPRFRSPGQQDIGSAPPRRNSHSMNLFNVYKGLNLPQFDSAKPHRGPIRPQISIRPCTRTTFPATTKLDRATDLPELPTASDHEMEKSFWTNTTGAVQFGLDAPARQNEQSVLQ